MIIIKIYKNDLKSWHNKEGQLHRIDGSAAERINGSKQWWINGKLHRVDGPAIEWARGDTEWWINGLRHRIDGPAVEHSSGRQEWWINGNKIVEGDKNMSFRETPPIKLGKGIEAVSDSGGGCTRSGPGGDCEYYVGFGVSVPGQHDGPDDTVDVYGRPNGWCWSCWKSHQIEAVRNQIDSRNQQIEFLRNKLKEYNNQPILSSGSKFPDWQNEVNKAISALSGDLNYANVAKAKNILKELIKEKKDE